MKNFKDESFIAQYLSPKLIRDFKFFSIKDDEKEKELEVTAIHNDSGYQDIRRKLSEQYNLSMTEPNIEIYKVDLKGDRSLTLHHKKTNNINLADTTNEVVKHLHKLWGFPVKLMSIDEQGEKTQIAICPSEHHDKQ